MTNVLLSYIGNVVVIVSAVDDNGLTGTATSSEIALDMLGIAALQSISSPGAPGDNGGGTNSTLEGIPHFFRIHIMSFA